MQQRAQPTETAHVVPQLDEIPTKVQNSMPDKNWMACEQLMKPINVATFPWSESDGFGAILRNIDCPDIIAQFVSLQTDVLSNYAFFRMDYVFKIQVNSTKFHQGCLIASYDPFRQFDEPTSIPTTGNKVFNSYVATGLPNVLINASSSEPVEIEIPFDHVRNFLTTNSNRGFDLLGRLRISVLNRLQAATGASTDVDVSVFLHATNAYVSFPIYRHPLLVPSLTSIPEEDHVAHGLFDSILSIGKGAVSTFGNVATGNWGGAVKDLGSTLNEVADTFNLDKPTDPVFPHNTIIPLGPFAHGKGVDRSTRLALDPLSTRLPDEGDFMTRASEMSWKVVTSTPMFMGRWNWSDTSTTPGTNPLFQFPVTPNISSGSVDTSTPLSNRSYNETFLAYAARHFCFWSGSIDYQFDFISTQFHTGKLLIAFIPNAFGDTPTFDQVKSCPNVIMDLQESSTVSFKVAFASPTYKKRTYFDNGTNLPTGETYRDDEIVGWVSVWVLNRLRVPDNVANNVDINVYIKGGDDFVLDVPRNPLMEFNTSVPPPAILHEAHGLQDISHTRSGGTGQSVPAVMTFGSSLVPDVNHFGEKFPMIDMIRRFTFNSKYAYDQALKQQALIVAPRTNVTFPETNNNFLTTIGRLFALWRGSIRYKIIPNSPRTSTAFMSVVHSPDALEGAFGLPGYDSYSTAATSLAQNNTLEVETPYYSLYTKLLTRPTIAATPSYLIPWDAGRLSVYKSADTAEYSSEFLVYDSAGEDFVFSWLVPPGVIYDNQFPGFPQSIGRTSMSVNLFTTG